MTKLQYESKFPKEIAGTWRHELIHSFHQWKGCDFVPLKVHKVVWWSKEDPFIEDPIPEAAKSELREAGQHETLKRKCSMGDKNLSSKCLKPHVHFNTMGQDMPVMVQPVC